MELAALVGAIKALGHKVAAPVLFKQAAFIDGDVCGAHHEVIAIFDQPVTGRVVHALVLVAGHAIESEEPIVKAFIRFNLTGAHLVRFLVPGDNRLTAIRSKDLQRPYVRMRTALKRLRSFARTSTGSF